MLAVVLWMISTALLITVSAPIAFYLVFAGLGAAVSGFLMSQQTIVLEFGQRTDLAMRLGLANTLDGVFSALGPLLAGLVAAGLGYGLLFSSSIVLLGLTFVLILRMADPRRDRVVKASEDQR